MAIEVEPNNEALQATRVSGGIAITGHITGEGTADWYMISVCAERILDVRLTNDPVASTPVDLSFELYGPDAEDDLDGEEDYDGEDGITSLMRNYYVPAAGAYYVRVFDWSGNDVDPDNSYTLTVTALNVPDGDVEPNGNTDNPDVIALIATPVESGVEATGYIASKEDEDWYSIEVDGEWLLQVDVENGPVIDTAVDLSFEVFAPNADTELGDRADYDGSDSITSLTRVHYVPEAGRYLVRVYDWSNDDYDYDQPYHITLTLLPVPDGDAEPNGNVDNPDVIAQIATPVDSGVGTTGYIASEEDEDWYAIDVDGERIFRVEVSNTPVVSTPVDLSFEAFGTDAETEMDGDEDYDGSDGATIVSRSYYAHEAGTYFVRVWDWSNDDSDHEQGYEVTVTVVAAPDAEAEPNGNSDNPDLLRQIATPISSGQPSLGWIASHEDDDWYVATVGGNGTLSLQLSNAPAVQSPVDLSLEVYAANDLDDEIGKAQDYDGGDGTTLVTLDVDVTPGDYLVRVFDWSNDDVDIDHGYSLTATWP